MSTPADDRLFMFICLVGAWTILRIAGTVLGAIPWSWWIIVAMVACVSAFAAFGNQENVA